jgi:hypothetical protein
MIYVGIDNGVTGSIGLRSSVDDRVEWWKTPVKRMLNYTKKKAWLNRIDCDKLKEILTGYMGEYRVIIERPLVNPAMFKATTSALRALEATLVTIESLNLSYEFIDSKEWQKAMLPAGLKGRDLKIASKEIAHRLFPNLHFTGDGDGILIAEYARRKYAV